MRIIHSTARYDQWYNDTTGVSTFTEHDTDRSLVQMSSLDLVELWEGRSSKPAFVKFIAKQVIEDDVPFLLTWCQTCDKPLHRHLVPFVNCEAICHSCYEESYFSCNDCSESYPRSVMLTADNGDTLLCIGCRENNWHYCDACDTYRDEEHEHDEDEDLSTCVSPALEFAVPFNGETLAQDTRATVSLPAGEISPEGMDLIRNQIHRYRYLVPTTPSEDPYGDVTQNWRRNISNLTQAVEVELGIKWQTTRGNYTKRLSSLAHKRYAMKLPPELLSAVGTIAADHSRGRDIQVEVTRDLNLPPEEFCNDDSCWWQSYYHSRCALKSNGGFGLRSFDEGRSYCAGRAWVLPVKRNQKSVVTPTFDTLKPDAFIMFNTYGNLEGFIGPRLLAQMAGWTYRRVEFVASPMYVNAFGYLVAPESLASKYGSGSGIAMTLPTHSDLYQREADPEYAERVEREEREALEAREKALREAREQVARLREQGTTSTFAWNNAFTTVGTNTTGF